MKQNFHSNHSYHNHSNSKTDKDKDKDKDKDNDKDKDKNYENEHGDKVDHNHKNHKYRHSDRHSDRHKDRHRYRHKDSHRYRHKDSVKGSHKHGHKDSDKKSSDEIEDKKTSDEIEVKKTSDEIEVKKTSDEIEVKKSSDEIEDKKKNLNFEKYKDTLILFDLEMEHIINFNNFFNYNTNLKENEIISFIYNISKKDLIIKIYYNTSEMYININTEIIIPKLEFAIKNLFQNFQFKNIIFDHLKLLISNFKLIREKNFNSLNLRYSNNNLIDIIKVYIKETSYTRIKIENGEISNIGEILKLI